MIGDVSKTAPRRPRVAIIGGGIAGLSAAMALSNLKSNETQSREFDVVVFESRKSPGGRAGSFTDPVSGATADYCQHVAMGCCTNFIDLLRDAGLSDAFTRYDELNFYHPSTGISPFRASRILPAPLHLNSALSGLRYLSWMQKSRIRVSLWSLMRTRESALTNMTAAQWLADHRQDAHTRSRFWDPILVSALGDVPERVSMSAARKVIIDGFASVRGASDVWVPNEALSHLFGDRLVSVLRQRGVEVQTGAAVRKIQRLHESSSHPVRLSIGESECHDFDHVIVAPSWRAASRLIGSIEMVDEPADTMSWRTQIVDSLESISPSPITGLHLWLDRSITSYRHVVMVGTTAQWLFHHEVDHQDPQTGHYHQVVISGRHERSDATKDELISHVMDELREAFPDARDAQIYNARVVTDPAAVYSVCPEFESQRPDTCTPLPWLHLAGDYVNTGWPATMEGATISGRLAADSVRATRPSQSTPSERGSVLPGLPRGKIASWCILG